MVEQQGNPDGEQWGLCALMVVGGSMQLLVARETTQLAGSSGSQQYLGNMWWPRPCLGSGGEKVEMTKMFSMFGRYKLFWSGRRESGVSRDCDTIRERESPRLSLGAKNKPNFNSPQSRFSMAASE